PPPTVGFRESQHRGPDARDLMIEREKGGFQFRRLKFLGWHPKITFRIRRPRPRGDLCHGGRLAMGGVGSAARDSFAAGGGA
ncbi:MAG: hypothetical protein ACPIOQ_79105, partial [Promethearchaeia archaeon]